MTGTVPIPLIALRALEAIRPGMIVGLGSGKAATAFIHALAERVHAGLHIHGVPTSAATADLARQLDIPLIALDEAMPIDITVDGADEVDPNFNLIKGLGGALVREKIVAAASKHLMILIGPDNVDKKVTDGVGTRGVLPVEVVPFGMSFCRRRLMELGWPSKLRMSEQERFVTDNSNYILDCETKRFQNPADVERILLGIPGVVGTGLFIGMANTILIQDGETIHVRQRPPR